MSHGIRNRRAAGRRAQAPVFAALGDETRLSLLATLSEGRRVSISQLARGSKLTRQAITKHLRVLEKAGIVHGVREGRESLFEFRPEPLQDARQYLDLVSRQWDQALSRLRSLVESEEPGQGADTSVPHLTGRRRSLE